MKIKRRKGQALVIVVIIFALIMSVFAISISNLSKNHFFEETEIYQREQALYLAQEGINQMLYNINNGIAYSNGQSISDSSSGIGGYKATYIIPDNSGYGGVACIKGEGTVGQFTRVVYVSIIGGTSSDAFKYCLFTAAGGYKMTNSNTNTISMFNTTYGSNLYNASPATPPSPDWNWYINSNNYSPGIFVKINKRTDPYDFDPSSYSNKVVYIHYTGRSSKGTVNLNFANSTSYNLTIITNYPVVNVNWTATNGNNVFNTWTPVNYSGSYDFPLLIHNPQNTSKSKLNVNMDISNNDNNTFVLQGLIYSNSPVSFEYGGNWGFLDIKGMLIGKSLTTDWDYLETSDLNGDGRITTETIFDYTKNYYLYPPPHFSGTTGFNFLIDTYREEY